MMDANSAAAARLMRRAELPLLLTSLGEVELSNAVSLRVFRREMPASKARGARALFAEDLQDGVVQVRPVPSAAFERAKQIARKQTPHHGSRTLDVLHVACAFALGADIFYTFDLRQRKLAALEGLATS